MSHWLESSAVLQLHETTVKLFLGMMAASFGLKIMVSVVLLAIFRGQVDCKVERYALHIIEIGTPVNEEVDVDVENRTEVIRVPQHNDVDAMEVMHDFATNLSVSRIPSTQDCYVSKLDPSLPSPQKMKLDMDQASKQPLPDKVSIEKTATRVLGFANRLALPQKILDFCGSFPIYNVKEIPLGTMLTTNASLHMTQGQGRKKRHHEPEFKAEYDLCKPQNKKKFEDCHEKYGFGFTQKCSFKKLSCYYIVNCTFKHGNMLAGKKLTCSMVIHKVNYYGFCCEPICQL